jgi:hypothetical protein
MDWVFVYFGCLRVMHFGRFHYTVNRRVRSTHHKQLYLFLRCGPLFCVKQSDNDLWTSGPIQDVCGA